MQKPIKVLLPLDLSPHSLETARFALRLGPALQASFTLLFVLPRGDVEIFSTLGGESDEVAADRLRLSSSALKEHAEQLKKEFPAAAIDCQVVSGVPFREICRIAEEEMFQLIIIGTHGRTGLAHLLIGSTAERVVQHALCPVLSVKPRIL